MQLMVHWRLLGDADSHFRALRKLTLEKSFSRVLCQTHRVPDTRTVQEGQRSTEETGRMKRMKMFQRKSNRNQNSSYIKNKERIAMEAPL